MKKLVFYYSLYLVLELFYVTYCFANDSYPSLWLKFDRYIESIIQPGKEKYSLENKIKWDTEIEPGLQNVYRDMWTEFNANGRDKLPWCVYEAFNELKKQPYIVIRLTISPLKKFPTGRLLIQCLAGEYFSKKMSRNSEREGIKFRCQANFHYRLKTFRI